MIYFFNWQFKLQARFESDDEEENEQIQCVEYIQHQQRVLKVGVEANNKTENKTEPDLKQKRLGRI